MSDSQGSRRHSRVQSGAEHPPDELSCTTPLRRFNPEELREKRLELDGLMWRINHLQEEVDRRHRIPFDKAKPGTSPTTPHHLQPGSSTSDSASENVGTPEFATGSSSYAMKVNELAMCDYVAGGNVAEVRRLLSGGVDPNCTDYERSTPLHIAAKRGFIHVVDMLLCFHADPDLEDAHGKTPADYSDELGFNDITMLLQAQPANEEPSSATTIKFEEGQDFTTSLHDGQALRDTIQSGLVLVLVGLPGRGKTYVTTKIAHYLNWCGIVSKVFVLANYFKMTPSQSAAHPPSELCTESSTTLYPLRSVSREKDEEATDASKDGKPANVSFESSVSRQESERHHEEEQPATIEAGQELLVQDCRSWLDQHKGVAIVDGKGNAISTSRRMHYFKHFSSFLPRDNIIFLEISCDDDSYVLDNIKRAFEEEKKTLGHEGVDEKRFYAEYFESITLYERLYHPLSFEADAKLPFIRWINLRDLQLNLVDGPVPTKIVFFLQNLNPWAKGLLLSDCGEWDDLVAGRLGGNGGLTENGRAYSKKLTDYVVSRFKGTKFVVLTSTLHRATETCKHFAELDPALCTVHSTALLDEMSYGECEGMTEEEINVRLPKTLARMVKEPYSCTLPRAECFRDMMPRVESVIHQIRACDQPVVVVAHTGVLACLTAFFAGRMPDTAPTIAIPQHSAIIIEQKMMNNVKEHVPLGVPCARSSLHGGLFN